MLLLGPFHTHKSSLSTFFIPSHLSPHSHSCITPISLPLFLQLWLVFSFLHFGPSHWCMASTTTPIVLSLYGPKWAAGQQGIHIHPFHPLAFTAPLRVCLFHSFFPFPFLPPLFLSLLYPLFPAYPRTYIRIRVNHPQLGELLTFFWGN